MTRKELLSPRDIEAGKAVLDISLGVARNILDAVDQGISIKEIRESLDRIDKGKAIIGQDTRFFVLGFTTLHGFTEKKTYADLLGRVKEQTEEVAVKNQEKNQTENNF